MEEEIESTLLPDELNEIEERRRQQLEDAGIDEQDVIAKSKKNVSGWESYFNQNIESGKDDQQFAISDQWTAIERAEFNRLFKPAMTFNKVYDSVKKIAGEQRKNKPDLIVRSLTGKATEEQIDLRADLVRTISYQSQNDLIYQQAFMSALLFGFGAFQISIDYESPKSFNQIIKFDSINDPIRASFDPIATKPHKGDGNFCARNYLFSKEEFHATYPYIINPESYFDPWSVMEFQFEIKDAIVVCDYFQKEWFSQIVYKLSNGQTVTKDEWEEMQSSFKIKKELAKDSKVVGQLILDEIPKIVSERQSQDYKIMHYRLLKNQIIDFTEWPSKYLPIIFVDGDSHYLKGMQHTRSFIRDAKDAQRFINYVGSEIAAEIKNRRREQWLGTPDNIIGQEQMWRNPELQIGMLIAKPDQKTNMMPQKMPAWEISQSLLQQYQRGTADIKEIMGFFEESQGQESNAQSGVAIANRQLASSMSAYVYRDNLNQSIEQAGRVVLDLLPLIYGQDERYVVLSKKNGDTKPVTLNKQNNDGEIENSLDTGDYDIEIDVGPSFAVQKAASVQMLIQLIQTNPQVFPLVADLLAKNLDVQFMPQISERFQNLVPPEIIAKEKGMPPPPQQPNHQAQMQQLEMQNQMQQLQERAKELQIRQERHDLDKVELALKAQEMQSKLGAQTQGQAIEMKKADLDYKAKLAKIMADLNKSTSQLR